MVCPVVRPVVLPLAVRPVFPVAVPAIRPVFPVAVPVVLPVRPDVIPDGADDASVSTEASVVEIITLEDSEDSSQE